MGCCTEATQAWLTKMAGWAATAKRIGDDPTKYHPTRTLMSADQYGRLTVDLDWHPWADRSRLPFWQPCLGKWIGAD